MVTKSKTMMFLSTDIIEHFLAPVLGEMTHFAQGDKFATNEVRFSSEDVARRLSAKNLKTGDIVLLHSFMGHKTSGVRVVEVPSEVQVTFMCVCM